MQIINHCCFSCEPAASPQHKACFDPSTSGDRSGALTGTLSAPPHSLSTHLSSQVCFQQAGRKGNFAAPTDTPWADKKMQVRSNEGQDAHLGPGPALRNVDLGLALNPSEKLWEVSLFPTDVPHSVGIFSLESGHCPGPGRQAAHILILATPEASRAEPDTTVSQSTLRGTLALPLPRSRCSVAK